MNVTYSQQAIDAASEHLAWTVARAREEEAESIRRFDEPYWQARVNRAMRMFDLINSEDES
jgi:hypothetical protein